MKVVFATGIYPPDIGGPATYVSHLAPELAARGHEVEVVTYDDEASGGAWRREGDAFAVRRVPRAAALPRRYARYFAAVRRSGRHADIVYLQDPISAGVPGLAAALSRRIPTLLKVVGDLAWEISAAAGWVHDDIGDFQRRRYAPWVEALRRAQQLVARRATAVVVPSAYLAEVVQGWGVARERLTIVENAAPPPTSVVGRDESRQSLGLGEAFVVVSAGRLLPHKGFELLVAAAAELRDHVDPLRVLIAGEGPFRAGLAAEIDRLGVGDVVRMTGTLAPAEMERLQRAGDVFVLLSAYEGRSHVLLEAMQARVPIVASDIPGNRELLHEYPHAVLVPREAAAVGAAIRRVASGATPREQHADIGGGSTAAWEEMVTRTIRLMERTCGTSA